MIEEGETYGSRLGKQPTLYAELALYSKTSRPVRTDTQTEQRSNSNVLPMMSIIGGSRDRNHRTSQQRGKGEPRAGLRGRQWSPSSVSE